MDKISIHALLAESDDDGIETAFKQTTFLSTLSLRRATFSLLCRILFRRYFYPRSPCGERPHGQKKKGPRSVFLSTLSLRRATKIRAVAPDISSISIHALLAESDKQAKALKIPAHGISIHALLAESDGRLGFLSFRNSIFLSTLSLRRATPALYQLYDTYAISIHALLAESDLYDTYAKVLRVNISIHALLAESDLLPTSKTRQS